jgi:hypothetical protein
MSTQEQNKKAIQQGQQGGPSQKNQNAQLGLSGERDEKAKSGLNDVPTQQQHGNQNPGQTGRSGGQGKQDAPQNQKR